MASHPVKESRSLRRVGATPRHSALSSRYYEGCDALIISILTRAGYLLLTERESPNYINPSHINNMKHNEIMISIRQQ